MFLFVDRMELLEIAKANAAKALGTANFDLPASLRSVPVSKERNQETAVLTNGAKSEVSVLFILKINLISNFISKLKLNIKINKLFRRLLPERADYPFLFHLP